MLIKIQMTKNKISLLITGILLIISIIVTILHNKKSPGSQNPGTFAMDIPESISLKVYPIDKGWGYKIYIDSTLYIFQETIPGFSGNAKIKSQTDAMACGELVIKKLKSKKLPFISKTELDSLKISY